MYAFLNKEIENQYTKKTLEENFSKILTVMVPIIPHFALECIQLNNFNTQQKWPSYDENLLVEDKIKFVIQINGKKRAIIESEKNTEEKKLLEIVKKDNLLIKYIMNKNIKKIIFVKNKLINILI
jgi:leucyl-tRNA synthetase